MPPRRHVLRKKNWCSSSPFLWQLLTPTTSMSPRSQESSHPVTMELKNFVFSKMFKEECEDCMRKSLSLHCLEISRLLWTTKKQRMLENKKGFHFLETTKTTFETLATEPQIYFPFYTAFPIASIEANVPSLIIKHYVKHPIAHQSNLVHFDVYQEKTLRNSLIPWDPYKISRTPRGSI